MYLSLIFGANFSSESGPEIRVNVSMIIRFGGHVTIKKGIIPEFGEQRLSAVLIDAWWYTPGKMQDILAFEEEDGDERAPFLPFPGRKGHGEVGKTPTPPTRGGISTQP